MGARRGLLDFKVSDLLDAAQQAGGGSGSGNRPLGRIVVDADPRVLRRIDKLTAEVAHTREATERTARVVIGAAALVTTVVVLATIATRK